MVLTTGSEIKQVGSFSNEFTDIDYNTEIDIIEAELYDRYLLPKRSSFSIDNDYTRFFINDSKVYDIIRVRAQVSTDVDPSGYVVIGSTGSWTFTNGTNYIDLEPSFIAEFDTKGIRVDHIPKIFNLLATDMAALNLLDGTTIVDGEEVTDPQSRKLMARSKRYKKIISPRIMIRSSTAVDFDPFEYVSLNQSDFR